MKDDKKPADMNTETAANDLTQLSSREQLSALMDGALPPDQTRFLLRRLQHDAPLADCWQRWRMTGEVMRGLAPAQRLPADFALRVGAALRGETAPAMQAGGKRLPAWLRWGGGAAMAASLAVVALIARQPATDAPAPSVQLASSAPAVEAPDSPASTQQLPPAAGDAAQTLAAATAVAATARPQRNNRIAGASRAAARAQPAAVRNDETQAQVAVADNDVLVPQPDIVTRPWPRSVLPQYASGGLTVGFGDHARGAAPYNPFQAQVGIGNLPPLANGEAPQGAQAPGADAQRERQP